MPGRPLSILREPLETTASRSAEAVATRLGVVKAGAAIYVIDESDPEDGVNFIIRDIGSKAVIDYEWMESHESPHTSVQAHRF